MTDHVPVLHVDLSDPESIVAAAEQVAEDLLEQQKDRR